VALGDVRAAHAVVDDGDAEPVAGVPYRHGGLVGAAVLGDVGQRLGDGEVRRLLGHGRQAPAIGDVQ
jgi:hypothetical protein